mmetsp:Transcript_19465/g.53551  ORF Transcript_19465/g.53551 Transcript_19465/m.53551 type:complete len:102 (-) Transcript_19465:701-1006(-)
MSGNGRTKFSRIWGPLRRHDNSDDDDDHDHDHDHHHHHYYHDDAKAPKSLRISYARSPTSSIAAYLFAMASGDDDDLDFSIMDTARACLSSRACFSAKACC